MALSIKETVIPVLKILASKQNFSIGAIHNLRRQRIGREGFSKCLHKSISFSK